MNRLSLFDEIKSGGYETALITTFNIDFPFYEDVLLRRMRAAGIDHHLVLADHSMCVQSLASRPPVKAGYHYSLAPMKCPGAFHPKILLLLGKDKGLLAIGSHNLTLSGFGHNLEVTNVLKFHRKHNRQTLDVFQTALAACETWLTDYGYDLPEGIIDSFKKIPALCTWLTDEPEVQLDKIQLGYTSASRSSLWSQVQPLLPTSPSLVFGLSAFFDKSLSFLSTLTNLKPDNFKIAIQKSTVKAPSTLIDYDVDVLDSESLLEKVKDDSYGYVHAKLLYIQSKQGSVLISGSANLSAPAWLANGNTSNAEAVLIRQDEYADDSFINLGFNNIDNGQMVTELLPSSGEEEKSSTQTVKFILSSYEGGKHITIPWDGMNHEITIGYQADLNHFQSIDFEIKGDAIVLDEKDVLQGEILHINSKGTILSYVMIHYEQQIKEYSSTSSERKFRMALGSLSTDAPDMNIIFDCIGRLMLDPKIQPAKLSKASVKKGSQSHVDTTPDTLITELGNRNTDKESGRLKLFYEGDIALILNTLIFSMSTENSGRSGLNEDKYGRNEEETVGKDDEETEQSLESIAIQHNLDSLAESSNRKLKSVLINLDEYLASHGTDGCHAALGITVFIFHLMNEKESWVEDSILTDLFSILCKYLFTEKDYIFTSELDDDDFYKSDEWGRLLGYAIWLAYKAGVVMRNRLPVSASSDQKSILRWKNSCWLYFAQRVVSDDMVKSTAGKLFTDSRSEIMQSWFSAMVRTGQDLQNHIFSEDSGFSFASSPVKSFEGYRLVVEVPEKYIKMATVSEAGKINQYLTEALNIV